MKWEAVLADRAFHTGFCPSLFVLVKGLWHALWLVVLSCQTVVSRTGGQQALHWSYIPNPTERPPESGLQESISKPCLHTF